MILLGVKKNIIKNNLMGITPEQGKESPDVYNQNSRFLQDMSLVPSGTEKDSEKGESIGTLRKLSGSMMDHSNT